MPRITKGSYDKLLAANKQLRETARALRVQLRGQTHESNKLGAALGYRIKYGDGVEYVRRARQRNLRLIHAFDAAKQLLAKAIHAEQTDLYNEVASERKQRNGS